MSAKRGPKSMLGSTEQDGQKLVSLKLLETSADIELGLSDQSTSYYMIM